MKKKKIKKKNKKSMFRKFVTIFFAIFFVFSIIYFSHAVALYKSIETLIRILGCITLGVFSILLFTLLNKFKKFPKPTLFIILSIISLIYCSGVTLVGNKVSNIYKKISTISSNNYDNYSASIITRKNLSADGIKDIKNSKIGIISDKDDYEGYTIGTKILQENRLNNTVRYDSYFEMMNDLLKNKIDFAIVPTHYESMLSSAEGFEEIGKETKIIYSKEEKKEKEMTSKKAVKSLDEPFTILIMGIDTVNDGFSAGFNGDALLLVTFNPKTTNATILSIPRDTYMPIACMNNRKNKITNAGWRGESCIINSLENYFGIDIDYHIKINFNGVVELVNAVGGVEVDVPYSFCEQNSKRKFGKSTIFVKAGKQKLNGEEALAFARHRKVTRYMYNYCGNEYTQNAGYWNDFTRGQNQQVIIKALMSKLKDIDSYSKVESILNTISKNIETDIPTNSILSLYNLAKDSMKKSADPNEGIQMQKLYLSGASAMIYDYSYKHNSGTKLILYNYVAYDLSKKAVIDAMEENLGKKDVNIVKSFSFSIKNEYVEKVIGKNVGGNADIKKVKNFIGSNVSYAQSWANENGVSLSIKYVEGSQGQKVGQIIGQDVPEKTDIDMLGSKAITITVVDSVANNTPTPTPEPIVDNNTDNNNNDNNNKNSNSNSNNITEPEPTSNQASNQTSNSNETKPEPTSNQTSNATSNSSNSNDNTTN